MELTDYGIGEDGRIYYIPKYGNPNQERKHIVWGIGPHGFCHGVGSYINREKYKNEGIDIIIINEPTYEEIEGYYKLIDKFYKNLRKDD